MPFESACQLASRNIGEGTTRVYGICGRHNDPECAERGQRPYFRPTRVSAKIPAVVTQVRRCFRTRLAKCWKWRVQAAGRCKSSTTLAHYDGGLPCRSRLFRPLRK